MKIVWKLLMVLSICLVQLSLYAQQAKMNNSCGEGKLCSNISNKRVLAYDYIHERDVMWEKRIWREVNIAERSNHHFAAADQSFMEILMKEAEKENIVLYSTVDDQFTTVMSYKDTRQLWGSYDTITVFDPDTYVDSLIVVYNEFDPANVTSYRIKEVWFFDSETSTMKVRILGIAPIAERYDDQGHLMATLPLFWIYYPDARQVFANYPMPNPMQDHASLSWEDVFEARLFSGLIVKENNLYDRRIEDYAKGMDALLEAEKIHEGIRNYEHDLWAY